MKRVQCIMGLLLYANSLQAQEIIKYYDYKWEPCAQTEACFISIIKPKDGLWEKTDYYNGTGFTEMRGYYKDSSCKIKHGNFIWYYATKKIKAIGRYEDNQKEGIWTSYHYNGMMQDSATYRQGEWQGIFLAWHTNGAIKDSVEKKGDGLMVDVSWFDNGNPSSAGYYLNGKAHKTWRFYHENGNLAAVENYENGELVGKEFYAEDGTLLTDVVQSDAPALFGKAAGDWKKYIEKKVYFPHNYKIENGNVVVVTVIGTVNEKGVVEDAYVDIPVHPEFDQILLNTVKKSPQWKPAISHNRRVKDYFRQSLSFIMKD